MSLKQPCLKETAKQRLKYYLVSAAEDLIDRLEGLEGRRSDAKKAGDRAIRQQCTQVRQHLSELYGSLYRDFIAQTVSEVLEYICKFRIYYNEEDTDSALLHESILRSVLLPCLEHYDLTGLGHYSIVLAIRNLHLSPNLLSLRVPDTGMPKDAEMLLERINVLKNLQQFSYNYDCTDEVVAHLSQYCKKLVVLKIKGSEKVTDLAVEYLILLPELQYLDVSECFISEFGYKTLLTNAPSLVNITWDSEIDTILSNIPMEFLESFKEADVTITNPHFFTLMCSNVTRLTIASTERATDFSPLRHLNLKSLSIESPQYISNYIYVVIGACGPGLDSLEIKRMANVNFRTIANRCSNLRRLSLVRSSLMLSSPNTLLDANLSHFQTVRYLYINFVRYPRILYHHLHMYRNLKYFHASQPVAFTEQIVSAVIRGGGFNNLSEFVVENSNFLGREIISVLLQGCANLQTLGHLKTWRLISRHHLWALDRYILLHNYDIKLF